MEYPETRADSQAYRDEELSDRDLQILKALNQDGESTVAFQGLKRKLGMHQETLSRALTRLHRDGLVERTAEGYKINRKVAPILLEGVAERNLTIIRANLPSADLRVLTNSLKGSWFGSLRWLGYSDSDLETVLTWITEDGEIRVDLKVADSSITIQARVRESADVTKAIIASHELYGHISNLYSKQYKNEALFFMIGAENEGFAS